MLIGFRPVATPEVVSGVVHLSPDDCPGMLTETPQVLPLSAKYVVGLVPRSTDSIDPFATYVNFGETEDSPPISE